MAPAAPAAVHRRSERTIGRAANLACYEHRLRNGAPMRICVHSNRGPRGEESPYAFYLGGRRLPVVIVLERWSDATHRYFEVAVDDGRRFVLRLDPDCRAWELAAVFAAAKKAVPKTTAKAVSAAAPRKFFLPLTAK